MSRAGGRRARTVSGFKSTVGAHGGPPGAFVAGVDYNPPRL